jgi:putative PIN family toxin of toxin-antitoxin system
MVDTNILISAVLFPSSEPARALFHIAEEHQMILCRQIIFEFKEVIRRKFSSKTEEVDSFFSNLRFELVDTGKNSVTRIRDSSDQPILNAAIWGKVDVILTGDKDFLCLDIPEISCVSVSEFSGKMDS